MIFVLCFALLLVLYRPAESNLDSWSIQQYCVDFFGADGLLLWRQSSCIIRCTYENSQPTMYVQDGSDCSPGYGTHACYNTTCRKQSRSGAAVCESLNTKKAFEVDGNPCQVQCVASDGTLGDPVPVPQGTKCLYNGEYRGNCSDGHCVRNNVVLLVRPTTTTITTTTLSP